MKLWSLIWTDPAAPLLSARAAAPSLEDARQSVADAAFGASAADLWRGRVVAQYLGETDGPTAVLALRRRGENL